MYGSSHLLTKSSGQENRWNIMATNGKIQPITGLYAGTKLVCLYQYHQSGHPELEESRVECIDIRPLQDRYYSHLAQAGALTREMGGSSVGLAYRWLRTESSDSKKSTIKTKPGERRCGQGNTDFDEVMLKPR